MDNESIIFGKDQTQNIVSLEVTEDSAELFYENQNGTISIQQIDNAFWILTSKPVNNKQYTRLNGELHYKYAYTFSSKKDFFSFRTNLKRSNIDFYCINDDKEASMVRNGITYFKGMSFKDVSILSFDLETVGLAHDVNSKILCISTTYRSKSGNIIKKLFTFDDYKNQGEMLLDFCRCVWFHNPSIILGHNITSFDLPYMQFIAEREGIELSLGRDNSPLWFDNYESKFRKDGSQFYHYNKSHIYGRNIIDTMFLSIRYDAAERKFESYGLKQIIKQLNLEKPGRVFYDASKIRDNYKNPIEWEKIKEYCIDDSDDALNLYDVVGPPAFYATQSIPKSYQAVTESATGSQINSMIVRAYLQEKHSIPKGDNAEHYEGGISLGNPGVYHNVFKVDVASLYPSIMIEYQVEDKAKDPNGIFKTMVKYFTEERLKNKKTYKDTNDEYYNDLQATQKVFINSFYGFLGAPNLNFNSSRQAAFITERGREILNKAIEWAEDRKCDIVNADTDSISFCLRDQSDIPDFLRKIYLSHLNECFPKNIKWEDDGYYETVIILRAKNYILKEAGKPPKYKGSALKSPNKEKRLNQFIKDIIKELGIGRNDFISVYNKYVKEIDNITDISQWVTKKTITDKVLTNERTNESNVREALEGTEYAEGDKKYIFFNEEDKVTLQENFKGGYSKDRLYAKLHATAKVFEQIIDYDMFLNYKLKRNKQKLEEVLNEKTS